MGAAETVYRQRNRSVRFDEKKGRDVGDAESVAGGVLAGGVEQGAERDPETLAEVGRAAGIVLGDSHDLRRAGACAIVETLEKRESELAGGAGDLEEDEKDGAVADAAGEGPRGAVESMEFNVRGRGPLR